MFFWLLTPTTVVKKAATTLINISFAYFGDVQLELIEFIGDVVRMAYGQNPETDISRESSIGSV